MIVLLYLGALIICLGYMQFPDHLVFQSGDGWFEGLIFCGLMTPVVPFVAVFTKFGLKRSIHHYIATSIGALFGLAGVLITLSLTLLAWAFTGGGTIAFWQSLSLTCAVVSSILLLSAKFKLGTYNPLILIISICSLIGTWSLISIPVIAFKALKFAGDKEYCIAAHKRDADIKSFSQLRGLSFYTMAGSPKGYSQLYFHGILLVGNNARGLAVYNWSPRRMTFQRVEHPSRFVANVRNVCTPRADFLSSLSVW